jgi:hypothetical protein
MKVLLRDGNRKKLVYLHRLIAGAFIDNPNNHPMINHIDGNRLNNSIDNLEWCTNSENQIHAISIGLVDRGDLYKRLNNNGRRGLGTAKYVVNLDNGVFYESAREAGIAHGVRHGTMASWLNGSRPNKTNLRYA